MMTYQALLGFTKDKFGPSIKIKVLEPVGRKPFEHDDQGKEIPIVSDSELMLSLKTTEHYFLQKGFPENTCVIEQGYREPQSEG